MSALKNYIIDELLEAIGVAKESMETLEIVEVQEQELISRNPNLLGLLKNISKTFQRVIAINEDVKDIMIPFKCGDIDVESSFFSRNEQMNLMKCLNKDWSTGRQ